MTKILWEDRFSVGVEYLDNQHKGLIRIINDLDEAQRNGALIARIIGDLRAYVDEHFRDEEKQLESAGFPDLVNHKASHHKFEAWLESVETAHGSGYTDELEMAEWVSTYLRDWLINHILRSDMAYKPLLAA